MRMSSPRPGYAQWITTDFAITGGCRSPTYHDVAAEPFENLSIFSSFIDVGDLQCTHPSGPQSQAPLLVSRHQTL